ncbi:hypothetical protein G9A89_007349 [Geosiphon pyriformis]|nr:hypothetical protein G9A89_007349 [Geosiphon pyriformis]
MTRPPQETDDLTWTNNDERELIPSWEWEESNKGKKKAKEEEPLPTNPYTSYQYTTPQQFTYRRPKLVCIDCGKKLSSMGTCCGNNEEYQTATKFYCCACLVEHFGRPKQNNISGRGGMYNISCQYTILINAEPVINFLEPEEFHKHYQNLALTREKQEQWLAQLNTRLYHHCLISSNFEYCDDCDLIYNSPPRIIYTIPEEEEPINRCASELESPFNPDSNSDNNNNKNNGYSSIQNGNDNDNNINSDSNSDSNYKQYIALLDLTKEQELKWFSDNNEDIMPEHVHDTDARFNLRYSGKDAIKLEPHLCTCIDLKRVLEIPATTIVQLASQSSLAKRGINIRKGIINAGYIGNIIVVLQNDSKKAYIIEPNEKIAQAIFLPLLGITAKGIQGFGSMTISIPPYSQYMLAIERKEKEQEQIFEAEANLCESEEIELINLYISAKSYSCIKIPIYNNTGNIINIPEGTTIGYLTTEIEDQIPNPIPDFLQLCGYVNITSQTIYG